MYAAAVEVHWILSLLFACRLKEARSAIGETRTRAARIRNPTLTSLLGLASAYSASLEGDFEGAERQAVASIRGGDTPAHIWTNASADNLLGRVAYLRGDADRAFAHLARAAEGERHTAFDGRSASLRALLLVETGDVAGADGLLRRASTLLPQPVDQSPLGAWLSVAPLTEALALLGDRRRAGALRWLNEAALANGLMVSGVHLYTVTAGIACAAERDWAAAEAHCDMALQQVREGCLIAEPSVHYWRADMLLARDEPGDHEKARELLTAAADGYARFGMPGFERRARQRLAEVEGA
jgi:hypothetical protein